MTKVLFFGKLSDDLGVRSLTVPAQHAVSINDIIKMLAVTNKPEWLDLLSAGNILTAVNKSIEGDRDKTLENISEIAFFPPVTGG